MKDKYISPNFSVTIVNIENCLCNASSTLRTSENDNDFLEEWDQLEDDNREFQWN